MVMSESISDLPGNARDLAVGLAGAVRDPRRHLVEEHVHEDPRRSRRLDMGVGNRRSDLRLQLVAEHSVLGRDLMDGMVSS
jgi:hypothetical protein